MRLEDLQMVAVAMQQAMVSPQVRIKVQIQGNSLEIEAGQILGIRIIQTLNQHLHLEAQTRLLEIKLLLRGMTEVGQPPLNKMPLHGKTSHPGKVLRTIPGLINQGLHMVTEDQKVEMAARKGPNKDSRIHNQEVQLIQMVTTQDQDHQHQEINKLHLHLITGHQVLLQIIHHHPGVIRVGVGVHPLAGVIPAEVADLPQEVEVQDNLTIKKS